MMKLYAFVCEGTTDEVQDFAQRILSTDTGHTLSVAVPEKVRPAKGVTMRSNSPDSPGKFVTTEFARRVLMRRPSPSQPLQAVLTALAEASPKWLPRSELRRVVADDYTPQQLAGLMGAFGRRMSHTEGYDEEAHFFDYQWSEEKEDWVYRLPESVLEALQEQPSGSTRGAQNEAGTFSAPASP